MDGETTIGPVGAIGAVEAVCATTAIPANVNSNAALNIFILLAPKK